MNRTTDEWRCIDASGDQAPLTTDELRAKLRAGDLTPSTLVWRGGMPGWVPASRVPELGPEAKGPAPALPVGGHATPPVPVAKKTLLGVPPAPSSPGPGEAKPPRAKPPPAPAPRPAKRVTGAPPAPSGHPLLAVPPPAGGAPAAPASPDRAADIAGASLTSLAVATAEVAPSGGGAGPARAAEARPNGALSGGAVGAQALPRVVLSEPPIGRASGLLPASVATPARGPERPADEGRNGRGATLLGLSPLTAEEAQQLGALVSDGRFTHTPERVSRPPAENGPPIVVPTSSEAAPQPSLITRPAPFSLEALDVRLPPALAAPDVAAPESAQPLGDFGVFEDSDDKRRGVRALASVLRRRPALPAGPKLVAAFFGGGVLTFGALTLAARLLSPSAARPAAERAPAPAGAAGATDATDAATGPGALAGAAAAPPAAGPGPACALGPAPVRLAPRVARDVPVELAPIAGAEAVALGFSADGRVPRGLRVELASLAAAAEPVPAPRRAPPALLRVLPVAAGPGPLRWVVDAEREGDAVAGARTVPAEPPFVVGLGAPGVLAARRASEAPAIAWEANTAGADALRPLAVAGAGAWVAYRQGGRVWAGLLDGEGRPRGELRALIEGGQSGSPYWAQSGDEVAVAFAWRAGEGEPWSMRLARGPKHGPLGPSVAFATPPGGPGGDAIAPALAGLGEGRWVAAWTEGASGARAVRVATLGPAGDALGEAVTVSTPGANAGQASVAVAAGAKVMVAYLTAAGRGVYELWGASLACPSSAFGSSPSP